MVKLYALQIRYVQQNVSHTLTLPQHACTHQNIQTACLGTRKIHELKPLKGPATHQDYCLLIIHSLTLLLNVEHTGHYIWNLPKFIVSISFHKLKYIYAVEIIKIVATPNDNFVSFITLNSMIIDFQIFEELVLKFLS